MRSKNMLVATLIIAASGTATTAHAQSVPPTPAVPEATDLLGEPFLAPGPFPLTQTAVTFEARHRWRDIPIFNGSPGFTQAPRELLLLAVGDDDPESSFGTQLFSYDWVDPAVVGTGPIPMTTPWFNAGDNDLNISVADPDDPLAFPGPQWDQLVPQWDFRTYNPTGNPATFSGGEILQIDDPRLNPMDPAFDPTLAAIASPADYTIGNDPGGAQSGGFGPGGPPNYAWIPNAAYGVIMSNPALNGIDYGYLLQGLPVGTVRAHVHSSIDRGGGRGYSMITGEYSDEGGGAGAIFVSQNWMTRPISLESVIDHTSSWFPYAEGWLAGWVEGNDPDANFVEVSEGGTTITAANPSLGPDVAEWTSFARSEGRIELPGIDPSDGMLFMNASDNSAEAPGADPTNPGDFDSGKIIGVLPDDSGWDFILRFVNGVDFDGSGDRPEPFPEPGDPINNAYSFVFIPYDACNLVGGYVHGDTAMFIEQVGDISITRIDRDAQDNDDPQDLDGGFYALEIPGASPEAGGLILQIADGIDRDGDQVADPIADRAYADYEWDPDFGDDGAFIVNTFELTANALLGFDPDVRDADFYVAYIPFESGIQPEPCSPGPCVPADLAAPFGLLDGADVNAFITAFGGGDDAADLNEDGVVDGADVNGFITQFGAGCP